MLAFRELDAAVKMFVKDTNIKCSCFSANGADCKSKWPHRKAIKVLRLYHAVCYSMFFEKPTDVDRALDLAEWILQNDDLQVRLDDPKEFTSALPITTALFMLATLKESTIENKKRVTNLLRQFPQRELLFDSKFVAALNEVIMQRETGSSCLSETDPMSPVMAEECYLGGSTLAVPVVKPLKIFGVGVTYAEDDTARIVIQTWDDLVNVSSGREEILKG